MHWIQGIGSAFSKAWGEKALRKYAADKSLLLPIHLFKSSVARQIVPEAEFPNKSQEEILWEIQGMLSEH